MTYISQINIYPIKSCGGISLQKSELTTIGLKHDRQFVLVDGSGRFLSQRRVPKMCFIGTAIGENLLWATFSGGHCSVLLDGGEGEGRKVDIWGGIGTGIDMGDEAAQWFSECLEMPCRLLRQDSAKLRKRHSTVLDSDVELSFADGYPVHIISEESLADLNGRLDGSPVPMDRFRPNIVVSGCHTAFAEDAWHIIQAGSARLTGAKLCARCSIPMVDQATGKTGREPMTTLASYRKVMPGATFGVFGNAVAFGKNFIVLEPGIMNVNDAVIVVS